LQPDVSSVPLRSDRITEDLGELIEECYVRGVLAEKIPLEPDVLQVRLLPIWRRAPWVDRIEVALAAETDGRRAEYAVRYSTGRWARQNLLRLLQLEEQGLVAKDQTVYQALIAVRSQNGEVAPPPLQPPPIVDESLEAFGVRRLGDGELAPDRPVLLNARMVDDMVQRCEQGGLTETGGAVLGKMIRLPAPLPGTATRVVTILSMALEDERHTGSKAAFAFSPEGLAEAARIGEIRGRGEFVITVFHSHGWSEKCAGCNQNAACPLAQASPSLQDYQLLESLFPGKGSLMPIAGRKLGADARHPVVQLHAWCGGKMTPIHWQRYHD
jgi:hypothetical protein